MSIHLPQEVYDDLEDARGLTKRSTYITDVIRKHLKRRKGK